MYYIIASINIIVIVLICFFMYSYFDNELKSKEDNLFKNHDRLMTGLEKQQADLKQGQELLSKRKKHFTAEVSTKVAKEMKEKEAELEQQKAEHNKLVEILEQSRQSELKSANKAYQHIIDASYKYKERTLLSNVTIKNQATKLDQILKEINKYQKLIDAMKYFGLTDRSDWDSIKEQFYTKVELLSRVQMEREAQAELKRQMREEKQREDEIARMQKEAEEEEIRLEEQRVLLEKALVAAKGEHKAELERQRIELGQLIADTHKLYERAKSMAQLTKQGHVYIISNIGSFGDDVYKVGMTRRLEPMDRIKELGDASVPFEFDVHAMISCDDAPALEKALHIELSPHQMNKVNPRKEFFKVNLPTIIDHVTKHHGTVEYVVDPVALQYFKTMEIESIT